VIDKNTNTLQFVFFGPGADANYRKTLSSPSNSLRAFTGALFASTPEANAPAAPSPSTSTTTIALGAALGGVALVALIVLCVMRTRHEKEARHLRIESREYMLNTQRNLYPSAEGSEADYKPPTATNV